MSPDVELGIPAGSKDVVRSDASPHAACRDHDALGVAPACQREKAVPPKVKACTAFWNAPENRVGQQWVAQRPFTRAAVSSWKLKTGDDGCSVAVVAASGRWSSWGNTVLALQQGESWGPPVRGRRWGGDTPEPLPAFNADLQPDGTLDVREPGNAFD
jgi:hypothetical protein